VEAQRDLGVDGGALGCRRGEANGVCAPDPTRVFTKEELLRTVWGYRTPSRTVDSHASRLRQKLASHDRRLVISVWGVGYRLCDPAVDGSNAAS
jgi:DNA-binding winged helix-turn-helix (wHTH) protein